MKYHENVKTPISIFHLKFLKLPRPPFHYSKNKNSARHECCSFYYSLGVRDDGRPVGKKVFFQNDSA